MKLIRRIKLDIILISSVFVALGVILLLWPEETQSTICYILALLAIAVGVCFAIDYWKRAVIEEGRGFSLAFSLSAIVLGVVILIHADDVIEMLPFVLSALVMFSGFMKLQNACDMKKLNYKHTIVHVVLALIAIIIGVLLLFEIITSNQSTWIGVGLIYGGFTDLVSSFILAGVKKSVIKDATKEDNDTKKDELK